MIKVMIAYDNPCWISSCAKLLAKEKNLTVCGISTDGEDTINNYLKIKPDVLLLDLDMPKISGAEIINQLSVLPDEEKKRNVLIVSGHLEEQSKFRKLTKVYNLLPKPVYNSKLIDSIWEIANVNNKKTLVINEIKDMFIKLKLSIYSKGAKFLLDAITMCYEDEMFIDNMKSLYIILSHKYKISEKNIQWSIENSLRTIHKYVSIEDLNSIFLYTNITGKISPKQFIELMLEYLNRKKI